MPGSGLLSLISYSRLTQPLYFIFDQLQKDLRERATYPRRPQPGSLSTVGSAKSLTCMSSRRGPASAIDSTMSTPVARSMADIDTKPATRVHVLHDLRDALRRGKILIFRTVIVDRDLDVIFLDVFSQVSEEYRGGACKR